MVFEGVSGPHQHVSTCGFGLSMKFKLAKCHTQTYCISTGSQVVMQAYAKCIASISCAPIFACFPVSESDHVMAETILVDLVWVTCIAAFDFRRSVSMTAGLKAVLCCACRGSGSCDNIEAYVSPAMLQDPWAGLMKQHQQSAPAEQTKPLVDDTGTLQSAAGHSMSDMFDAVEQVNALPCASVCRKYTLSYMEVAVCKHCTATQLLSGCILAQTLSSQPQLHYLRPRRLLKSASPSVRVSSAMRQFSSPLLTDLVDSRKPKRWVQDAWQKKGCRIGHGTNHVASNRFMLHRLVLALVVRLPYDDVSLCVCALPLLWQQCFC